ncbi:MAG: thiamine pyrophosphate-dependent dehydrogenase E1 component subunit alpha [Anaerolineales bacterium]
MLTDQDLYQQMFRIRCFEETLLENFSRNIFSGTTHTCLGQEANAVGVLSQLEEGDVIFSNHRAHGHFLAVGGDMRSLFAELMGRVTGVCAGKGGSQHLHWKNFYSNGVQGGIVPIATGMALAEKYKESGRIVVSFLGDGTLGQGVVYETLNMASLWQAPILFVLENNRIAQTTPIELAVAGSIPERFHAFGIPAFEADTCDVTHILEISTKLIKQVRTTQSPCALIIHSQRFGPHSKSDDTRSPEYLSSLRREYDPLTIQAKRLDKMNIEIIHQDVEKEVKQAFQAALEDPFPTDLVNSRNYLQNQP